MSTQLRPHASAFDPEAPLGLNHVDAELRHRAPSGTTRLPRVPGAVRLAALVAAFGSFVLVGRRAAG
jgi:hypothetical protein